MNEASYITIKTVDEQHIIMIGTHEEGGNKNHEYIISKPQLLRLMKEASHIAWQRYQLVPLD